MELKELLYKRQSIRRFKPDDVPVAAIREIIDAARVAPSEKNLQNWHFVVIKNRALIGEIAEAASAKSESIAAGLDGIDQTRADKFRKFAKNFTLFFTGAPVLIVVMATGCIPTGYAEYERIGADPSWCEELMRRDPAMQSVGAAIENLTLRAFDIGYGLCWMSSANYAAAEIESIIRRSADFTPDYFMAALLALGAPEDGAKSPPKKTLDEIMSLIDE